MSWGKSYRTAVSTSRSMKKVGFFLAAVFGPLWALSGLLWGLAVDFEPARLALLLGFVGGSLLLNIIFLFGSDKSGLPMEPRSVGKVALILWVF